MLLVKDKDNILLKKIRIVGSRVCSSVDESGLCIQINDSKLIMIKRRGEGGAHVSMVKIF